MISKEQIEELDRILGKCVRLCAWIEYQVTEIYAFHKTKDMPIGIYQDKNFNICVDKKVEGEYMKALEKYESDSFNKSLKSLIENDKNYEYFSKKQYMVLDEIRKLRNKVFHNSMCLYLYWNHYDGKEINEYNADLKKAKRLLSLAEQYKDVIDKQNKSRFAKMWQFPHNN